MTLTKDIDEWFKSVVRQVIEIGEHSGQDRLGEVGYGIKLVS